jgi:hypothetical protein
MLSNVFKAMVLGILFFFQAHAQSIFTTPITPLASVVGESSGLTKVNGVFITHNDSGNDAILYELDTITGQPARQVWVSNATNRDWEALTRDDNYLYIGDIGNNLGNRTDLRIYKIALSDYLQAANDSVLADTINFFYPEQTIFPGQPFQTAFDAEALIAMGDSLYIFTKNWSGSFSMVYALPKTPGYHVARLLDTVPITGLVTDATLNPDGPSIFLTSNTPQQPHLTCVFLSHVQAWTPIWPLASWPLTVTGSIQVEAIHYAGNDRFFITSETGLFGLGYLSEFAISANLNIREPENVNSLIFPNPTPNTFMVQLTFNSQNTQFELFNLSGAPIPIQVVGLPENRWEITPEKQPALGIYLLKIVSSKGTFTQKIQIK